MEKPKMPNRPSEIDLEFALDEFTEIRKQAEMTCKGCKFWKLQGEIRWCTNPNSPYGGKHMIFARGCYAKFEGEK